MCTKQANFPFKTYPQVRWGTTDSFAYFSRYHYTLGQPRNFFELNPTILKVCMKNFSTTILAKSEKKFGGNHGF